MLEPEIRGLNTCLFLFRLQTSRDNIGVSYSAGDATRCNAIRMKTPVCVKNVEQRFSTCNFWDSSPQKCSAGLTLHGQCLLVKYRSRVARKCPIEDLLSQLPSCDLFTLCSYSISACSEIPGSCPQQCAIQPPASGSPC